MANLAEYVDGLPNISGSEERIRQAIQASRTDPVFLPQGASGFGDINSAFTIALHMHQPLIPAGGPELRTAQLISNVQWMLDNPDIGDNHNARVFLWCYRRMGEFVPQLLDEGFQPRVMLEYSGTLLAGLRQMGASDVLDALARLTGDERDRRAVIKTQGSDTKLIGQMQPYSEAKGLSRLDLAGKQIPPLVTQIADGENGGVMMNEFPAKYFEVMRECSGSLTPIMNVTEYLERLESVGVHANDLPVIQPLFQSRIWERMVPGDGPDRLAEVIKQLRAEDGRFHMEGGSWTNSISWVQGYDTVLVPMEKDSSLFHKRILATGIRSDH